MESSFHLHFTLFYLVSVFLHLNELVAHSLSPPPPLQPIIQCDAGDSSALLQFKDSFVIDKLASFSPLAYPKVHSWLPQGDCCSWDGVLCDDNDGHVIGLDLSSSCLFGSINSDSSLFRLRLLRMLSLADNNFNYSRIPPELAHLSRSLTHLDLSRSYFSGQIPVEISRLSKLVVLSIALNIDSSSQRSLLQLNHSTFENIVQNVTSLEQLVLSGVDISSKVPNTLANLSSLSLLYLRKCNLQGEFPSRVFLLPKLESLSIRYNRELTGRLPHFSNHSQLKYLMLGETNLSGELPYSIQNLHSLTHLDLSNGHFSGPLPSSLASLAKLEYLGLESCQLTGDIPIWIPNFTQLRYLALSFNFLQGPIPESMFSQLLGLEYISFRKNNLSGTLDLEQFPQMANLDTLDLGYNQYLSAVDCNNCSDKFPNLTVFNLEECSINKFPSFLKHQHKLVWFSLRSNRVHGLIPSWLWNTSKDTLSFLDVADNLFTGFGQHVPLLPWVNLQMLDISSNLLQGSLPVPLFPINFYFATSNKLTGKIPLVMCNLSNLYVLNLAFNDLSGKLPQCLSNMTNLSVLILDNNNFHGSIPQISGNGSKLEMLYLNQNQLQGKIPRSLANCAMLRKLDLGENLIDDTFPFWMGELEFLQILIIRSNKFHGAISESTFASAFPHLRIIDLSHNGFSGHLPSGYFRIWKGMEKSNTSQLTYLETNQSFHFLYFDQPSVYIDTMVLTNKGVELVYAKIPNGLAAIDFSSNNFSGEIPESIGDLNGLYVLNLSNNHLTGRIPSSLSNLTSLESLDLSRNQLSGEIPHQLAEVNFLEFLNVSSNNLTGRVPRGRQLDTFEDNSFEGNSGLCGELLIAKRCAGDSEKAPPSSPGAVDGKDEEFLSKYDWIVIAMGYASGAVVGFVVENTVLAKKPQWFVRIFGKRTQMQTKRESSRSRRN